MKISTAFLGRSRRTLLALAATGALWLGTAPARAQAPANDDPCGAVTLTPQGSLCTAPTVSTNLNATTTVPNGYANSGNPLDVWFAFTTAATGPASFGATITVNGNPATFVQLFSAPACTGPFTALDYSASNQANTTAPRLITGVLLASTTYYVRVSGNPSFNDTPGPFTICVSDGPGSATCLPPVITSLTQTAPGTVTIAFTPGRNSVPPYAYTYTGNGATRSGTTATSPIVLTGLPLGPYSFTLGAACSSGGQASAATSGTLHPINDEACGALPLPFAGASTCAGPTSGSFDYAVGTGGLALSNCNIFGNQSPPDLWYAVTTTASGPGSTSLTVTGTGGVQLLRLYAGTPSGGYCNVSTLQERACSSSGGLPTAAPLTATGLTPGTTYYVQAAQSNTGISGPNFTLCATAPVSCAPPVNLFVGNVTTTTAPLIFTPGFGNTGYTVTYTPLGGTALTATFPALPYTLSNLLPGTPYTVSVVGNCGGGQTSAAATATFSTLIGNDEPCTATPVALSGVGCTATAGTTTGATASPATGYNAQGCGYGTSNDVWYTFTTAATGVASTGATITLPNGVSKQVRAFSASSCSGPFTELGCAFSSPGTTGTNQSPVPPLALSNLTPSTTYYVSVGEGNYFGLPNFSLCVSNPPACPGPTALAVGGITQTGASVSFTPAAGTTSYTVTYQATGGPVQTVAPAPTASPVLLSGLTASTTYTVTVQAVCPAGLGTLLTATLTTLPVGLTNDECATAVPVASIGAGTCGTAVAGTTTGATTSAGVPAPGCAGSTFNDVWYSLTVPANGILQVETDPVAGSALTDTGLALYAGTCGSLTLLGCNDDSRASLFSQVRSAGLTPGSTVYARVWNYGSTPTGAFTLCAQTDAACPAVTGLAATIAGTTASVAFTGPGSATGYTLTYTPSGGTATTVTATASPVSIPGLLPFTTYTVAVVSNCGGGLTSAVATLTFSTSTYCITNIGGGCGGNDIVAVAIPTTTLNNAGTTCVTTSGNAYATYPATGSSTASLLRNGTYQYRVTTTGTSDITAWIDFNQDGVFSTGEGTQVALGSIASLPATATFTVPATAALGRTGLRVRSRSAGNGNGPADACTQFGSGETEDYLVTIVLGTATHESALAAQVSLYPNPATAVFTLAVPAALTHKATTAALYNSLGQVVRRQRLPASATGTEARFDVSGLAHGVYSLRLDTDAGTAVKRLVVE
ncbi:fibronectin type III domain-containing protein [Hymenobacter terricola]|uniref:fibronectin type III domain-containing protein n=1 Tax=Hymenobacter terricola TaxID=2819236 RepID=UPI001B303FD3|nr:fibronectin type III domain-containing protein [Hymenobacter terricola]